MLQAVLVGTRTDLIPEAGLDKRKRESMEMIGAGADLARAAVAYDHYFECAWCAHRRRPRRDIMPKQLPRRRH